jgi:hypothetical protein
MCFLWGRAIRKNASIIGLSEIEGRRESLENRRKPGRDTKKALEYRNKKGDIVVREEKTGEFKHILVQFRLLAKSLIFKLR